MHAFDYESPKTLSQALDLLSRHNGHARPLAGGTDLIDQIRIGRRQPEVVIDVKKLPELNVLVADASGLRLGAAVPCYRIGELAVVRRDYTALADSCAIIGGVQIQSRASFGGNLCNSGPAGDSIPSMMALRGVCVIAGANGTREVPVESFCTGPGKNVLQPGELLVEIRFPAPAPHTGSHYRRLIPRNEMDIAVVGVGVAVTLEDDKQTIREARIALGAVGPTPIMATEAAAALAGKPATEDALQQAAAAARQAASPITDMRGTKEYRVHVTGVLVQRSLQLAIARARGESVQYDPGH
jgi:carbon-monoxide dehydrogenase medium subunit